MYTLYIVPRQKWKKRVFRTILTIKSNGAGTTFTRIARERVCVIVRASAHTFLFCWVLIALYEILLFSLWKSFIHWLASCSIISRICAYNSFSVEKGKKHTHCTQIGHSSKTSFEFITVCAVQMRVKHFMLCDRTHSFFSIQPTTWIVNAVKIYSMPSFTMYVGHSIFSLQPTSVVQ